MSDSAFTIAGLAAVWTGALAAVYRGLTVRTHVLFYLVQHKNPILKRSSPSNKSLRAVGKNVDALEIGLKCAIGSLFISF